ncbi:hypothetical protein [Nitrospira sp. Nam74]
MMAEHRYIGEIRAIEEGFWRSSPDKHDAEKSQETALWMISLQKGKITV